MNTNDLVNSEIFNNQIIDIVRNRDIVSENKQISDIKNLIIQGFNYGIVSVKETTDKNKKSTILKKSKEISNMLPDNFVKSPLGKQLVSSVLESVKGLSENSVLNIGYEPILETDIEKIIIMAYAIGITTGFEISEDSDYKSMYASNTDRFIKHGIGDTK